MKSNWRYSSLAGAVAAALGGGAATAGAAGFFLPYQGTAAIGNSLAGVAALGEDASTVFWNPAGMARIDTRQIAIAGSVVDSNFEFTAGPGTTGPSPALSTGGNGSNAGAGTFLPNAFMVLPFGRFAFGLGVSATFGSMTEYDATWRGRFQAVDTEIRALNLNPSLSYRVNEHWSVGFGVNLTEFEAKFGRAVALGPATEGSAQLKGNDRAIGYNAGVLWEVTPETRLGLSYRSETQFELGGSQVVTTGGATIQNIPVRAELAMPAFVNLSGVHALNDRWSILGDAMWTQWSEIQNIDIRSAATGASTGAPLQYQFRDTWRFSGAVNYRLDEKWLFRVGAAWDQTPVRGSLERTASLPDSDRMWLSLGARWDIAPAHRLDFAYAHVFFQESQINRTSNGMTLQGDYRAWANLFSAQYTFSF